MIKTTAALDIDFVKYAVASIGQNPFITAIHKQTGDEYTCKTITEFWGHHSKKAGGILAELNKGRDSPFLPEEWEITNGYTLNPIENVLHSVKTSVEGSIKVSGASKFVAFLGEGSSFREGLSTLNKYKDRTSTKPHYLDDVTEYIKKKYKPIVVTGIEADDACVMECYGKPNHFVLGEDKDYYGCPIKYFNVNRPEEGVVDCNVFGRLWRKVDAKGKPAKVKGVGRLHLYWQMLFGDEIDTYFAHAQSDKPWGSVTAYHQLVDCKTDKEAFQVLLDSYRFLYPEPKTITTWRGEEVTIDALYVGQEMMDMARMLRWEGDKVLFKDVLDKLGVEH